LVNFNFIQDNRLPEKGSEMILDDSNKGQSIIGLKKEQEKYEKERAVPADNVCKQCIIF
jgi:hypothetical protein